MNKKQEIYDKALELFLEQGYDHTALSRIAESLNITKAGLYHYFKSKEDILALISEQGVAQDFVPILDASEKIQDPEERLKFFIRNYTTKILTRDPTVRLAIHEMKRLKPVHQKKILKEWRRCLDLVRNTISELDERGRIVKVNKTYAAFALIGMCTWTIYWFDYRRRESAEELADTYVKLFLNGLLKK
ncbi:MAG: TetR family transcriptional regulator [Deltaproteobacteria bacterium]|nr:TetR family transcriptional regulator [Deltaproteobacteria bacterium]